MRKVTMQTLLDRARSGALILRVVSIPEGFFHRVLHNLI